jgi:putative tricarboxylic transport membrane protein
VAAAEHWERVGAAALLAVGVAAAVVGAGYGLTRDTGAVGPGFMPLLAGGLLAIGSLSVLLRVGRAGAAPAEPVPDEPPAAPAVDRRVARRQIVLALVIMAVGAGLMSLVGFVLAAAVIVFCILVVVERIALWRALFVTVVITGVLWLVVHYLLIPVPPGPFLLAGGR